MFSYINYQNSNGSPFEYKATPGDLLCYVWKINPRTLEVSDMITLRNSIGADIGLTGMTDSGNYYNYYTIDNQQSYGNLLSTINIANDKAIIPYSSGSSYYSHVAIDLNDQSQVNFFKWIKDFGDETKGPAQWLGRFVEHSYAPLTLNNKIYIREYYRDPNNRSYVHDKEFDLTNYTVSWHAATTGAGFLTGNIKSSGRNQLLKALKDGEIDIIIGTHALFSANVVYNDLQLAVIDEQHRFGIDQRIALLKKAPLGKTLHQLVMTATPIPRTLHMSIVGVRDMSVIYEPPQNRRPVQTYVLEYDTELIKEAIAKNEQLASYQYAATRWWYWYLDDNIQNLEPIIIGGAK